MHDNLKRTTVRMNVFNLRIIYFELIDAYCVSVFAWLFSIKASHHQPIRSFFLQINQYSDVFFESFFAKGILSTEFQNSSRISQKKYTTGRSIARQSNQSAVFYAVKAK